VQGVDGGAEVRVQGVICHCGQQRGDEQVGTLVMMMMSFICSCRNKNQPKTIYPKGTSHHRGLFRGPSTNDMKK
jgi:hypothetical protein